jgi:hypothetical protein
MRLTAIAAPLLGATVLEYANIRAVLLNLVHALQAAIKSDRINPGSALSLAGSSQVYKLCPGSLPPDRQSLQVTQSALNIKE